MKKKIELIYTDNNPLCLSFLFHFDFCIIQVETLEKEVTRQKEELKVKEETLHIQVCNFIIMRNVFKLFYHTT